MAEDFDVKDLWLAMSQTRTNCELMFTDDADFGFLVTCRLRPWKNAITDQEMILAGGTTPEEAIAHAYLGWLDNLWVPLDWRARASRIGVMAANDLSGTSPRPRFDPERARKALSERQWRDNTPIPLSGPQNGVQEHSDDLRITPMRPRRK